MVSRNGVMQPWPAELQTLARRQSTTGTAAFGAAALRLLFESFTGFSVSYIGAFVALGVANAAAYTVDFFLGMGSLNILLSPATVLRLFVAAEVDGAHGSRSVSARHS
jgi:hypothetical protein